jgi:hypothetical protein
VSSALFQIGNASTSIAISSLQPLGSPEPIYVMTLDVVGPGNGCTTQFASGAGTITFSANQQLAFSASNFPSQCAGVNIGNQVTAEQAANIAYGTPQISASGTTVTQSFWASSGWVQLGGGGRGSNIAAGDGVHPWLTSSDGLHHIYYWNGTNWQQTNGSALNIAAYYSSTPQGNFAFPVIVGTNNRAYYVPQNPWTSGGTGELTFNWQEDPSGSFFSGSSLSAAGGTNFVGGPRILTNAYTFATGGVSGGYFSLFFNSTADGPFSKLPSDAFWISTGPDESALFALDGVGNLFTWYQGAWTDLGSNVSQVAAGTDEVYFYISNGAVFAAGGTFAAPEQLSWGSNMPLGTPPLQPTWANLPAPAANDPAAWGTRMSVGANGTLWVLDGEGAIWYLANPPGTGYQGVALGNP